MTHEDIIGSYKCPKCGGEVQSGFACESPICENGAENMSSSENHGRSVIDIIKDQGTLIIQLEAERDAARALVKRHEAAELAFELYATFGGYHPNAGSGSYYYLSARGTKVENEGWNDERVYPVGERFEKLTIENVLKTAFIILGKGGTFGDIVNQRLAAIEAAEEEEEKP